MSGRTEMRGAALRSRHFADPTVLEYCEPGEVNFTGYSPEQYEFCRSGIDVQTLSLFGWLFGGGDRLGQLPYKLIRSIIVCGVHHERQVEFAAYVAYNRHFGLLRDASAFTDDRATVLEVLPTGDSSNPDPSKFDPQGFASYCLRHGLYQNWRRCYISTCNAVTGKTAFGLDVPEQTMRGAPVSKSYFYNDSKVTTRQKSQTVYDTLVKAWQELEGRLSPPPQVGTLLLPPQPKRLGYDITNTDETAGNVRILAKKSVLTRPRQRYSLTWTYTPVVGFPVTKQNCVEFIAEWDCAHKIDEETVTAKTKETVRVEVTEARAKRDITQCNGFYQEYQGQRTRSNYFTNGTVALFMMKIDAEKTWVWVFAEETTYELYQASLMTNKALDPAEAKIFVTSRPLPQGQISPDAFPTLRWFVRKPKSQGSAKAAPVDKKLLEYAEAWNSVRMFEKWSAFKNSDKDVDNAWRSIKKWKYFTQAENQPMAQRKAAALMDNTALGEGDEVNYARVYLEYQKKRKELTGWMDQHTGIVSGKQIADALQEAKTGLAKSATKLTRAKIDLPTEEQVEELLTHNAAPDADVEVIQGFKCIPVEKINVRLVRDTIVTNQEDLDRYNDMDARRVQILTELQSTKIESLARKFLRYLFLNPEHLIEPTDFARLKQSYMEHIDEWEISTLKMHRVSETVAMLHGQGKSRPIRKVNTYPYSCLDECCVDFYRPDEDWKAYYGGFNFQLLAFTSREPKPYDSYLRAVLSAFCAKTLNGHELFQFQNLDAMQTLLLNQWYRAMSSQEAVEEYIERYAERRGGEDGMQSKFANALNLNIVELRLRQNLKLDSEKRAFDLVVLARYTATDNYIDKHWLPKSPSIDLTDDIFSGVSTEANVLAKPLTVYVLNMRDFDNHATLETLRLPKEQRERLLSGMDHYRTLLATHFHIGLQIPDPNVYKAFIKRRQGYDTTRGDLLLIPDTTHDEQETDVAQMDNQTYRLSEDSGALGMLSVISRCLAAYAEHVDDLSRFHSAENQVSIKDFGGVNTYQEKTEGFRNIATLAWKGMLDPRAVNIRVIRKFVEYFQTQDKKRKDKANENNKELHANYINPNLLKLLGGFMGRLESRYRENGEITEAFAEDASDFKTQKERNAFAKNFIDDLRILAAIYNLEIRLVEDYGKFDCNSLRETVLPALPVWFRKGKADSVRWWGGPYNWMTDKPDGHGRAPLVITLLYKEWKFEEVDQKSSGRIYWRIATKTGAFNLSNQAGIAQERDLVPQSDQDSDDELDEPDWESRDRARSGIVRAPRKKEEKKPSDSLLPSDPRPRQPDSNAGTQKRSKKDRGRGGDDFVSGGGGGGKGMRVRGKQFRPTGAHGQGCNHDEQDHDDQDYEDEADKIDRALRHMGGYRGGGGGGMGKGKAKVIKPASDQTEIEDEDGDSDTAPVWQGGYQKQVNEDGYTTVIRDRLGPRLRKVYDQYQYFKRSEQKFMDILKERELTEREKHDYLGILLPAIESFEYLHGADLDKLKRLHYLSSAFQPPLPPLHSLGLMMASKVQARHITVAQGREKEIYFLTMALGQMAGIVHILENDGWATFKIHTGQTEQSRYLATMIRPFFDQMECYPITKQYTSHILVVALGFRRALAESVNLADLIMSCGSLDANEMRMVCDHIEAVAYQHKAIRKEEYAAYKMKVYKTSCKMYMDWFDHNVAISKAYIQATLEGHVSAAPGYLTPEIAELLNRKVFSRMQEATRRKNLQVLRTIMATPFGEQLRPLFVSSPHPTKALMTGPGGQLSDKADDQSDNQSDQSDD